jgi:glutathione peroxidase
MTLRQKILKFIYPAFLSFKKAGGNKKVLSNTADITPPIPFHSLSVSLIDGESLNLEKLKGKKVLLVNTASDCAYTPQYAELQTLYEHSKEGLEIIAFPANDFGEQEKGTNKEIKDFCINNYAIRFPIARKSTVIKTPQQNPVFKWLTQKENNGWNEQPPTWNFAKYLVNEEGVLIHYFDHAVSPLSEEMIRAVGS